MLTQDEKVYSNETGYFDDHSNMTIQQSQLTTKLANVTFGVQTKSEKAPKLSLKVKSLCEIKKTFHTYCTS